MYLERNMKDRLYYLGEYLWDVFRCGRWKLYFAGRTGRCRSRDLHGGTGVLQCIDVYGRNVLMEQKEPVLVLYDREEEYARLFFRIPEEAKGIALARSILIPGRKNCWRERKAGR